MRCVDTTFLIDLLRNNREAVEKAQEMDKKGRAATTEMNVAEVVTGIHRLSPEYRDKALRQAESLFSRFVLLPLDHRAALMAGELLGELWNKGMAIETMDGLIAATALANGYNIIVTRNAAHFSNIKGLKAERY